MSRLGRAWRELRRADDETYNALFEPFGLHGYRAMSELRHPLERIATTLDKMERYKNRPRNIWCQHPELHDMEAEGLQYAASITAIKGRRGA